tara:strand:- start:2230 stop:2970 length:741 start_codon:yes stop_codon:yes gene_type:complete
MLEKIKSKIRYTNLYFFLLRFTNPKYLDWINKEFQFHQKFLKKKNKIIFDLGANRGDKTYIFSKYAEKIIAYEPEPKMNFIMKKRFKDKKIIIKNTIVSNKTGNCNFLIVQGNEAYSTINKKSLLPFTHLNKNKIKIVNKKSTTLNIEIKKYGIPEYIKIDCEGAEKKILSNLKFKVKIISFELNLPYFYNDGKSIINLMSKKFKCKFNLRIQDQYFFKFKKNINHIKLIKYLKKKKLTAEIFAFS